MTRLPKYVRVERTTRTKDGLTLYVRIRWWHPVLWLTLLRVLLEKRRDDDAV